MSPASYFTPVVVVGLAQIDKAKNFDDSESDDDERKSFLELILVVAFTTLYPRSVVSLTAAIFVLRQGSGLKKIVIEYVIEYMGQLQHSCQPTD